MKKRKWKIMLGLPIIIVLGVTFFYPEALEAIMFMGIILFCTYKWFEALVTKKGLKKLACIEWWIYAVFTYLIMNQEYVNTKNVGAAFIVFIGLILFIIRVFVIYFKTNDWQTEVHIAFGSIFVLFVFAVGMVEVPGLFWIFKILTLFTIFSTVKIVGHTTRFWGMLLMCFSYVLLIILNGMLNSQFLLSPLRDGWSNFYIATQNLYTLPELETLYSSKAILEHVFNFLMCRIVDAVLIGSLVDIFNEKHLGWFEKKK